MAITKVCVVIATHNGRWLREALDSVASQDYGQAQTIISLVDDGSDPSFTEFLRPAIPQVEHEPWLTHYRGTPLILGRFPQARGPSAARNQAVRQLRQVEAQKNLSPALLLQVLDDDDRLLSRRLSTLVPYFQDVNVGAVYSDYDTLDEKGLLRRVHKEPYSRQKLERECIVHSACLMRADLFEQLGGYDVNLRCAEDYDMWLRLSEKSIFIHHAEPLMVVRVHGGNSSCTVPKERWEADYRRVMEKMMARRGSGG